MKVLITGGSTRTMIDKVRCISNIFKGKTAMDIAYGFLEQDNDDLIIDVIGNLGMNEYFYSCINFFPYKTYDELYNTMENLINNNNYDVIIHSAAVSDYKPVDVLDTNNLVSVMSSKVSSNYDELYIKMVKTEKIVDKIRGWGFSGKLVKFKLQVDISDEELIEIAKKSRETSDADIIVANCLEWAKERVIIIDRDDSVQKVYRDDLPYELYKRVI